MQKSWLAGWLGISICCAATTHAIAFDFRSAGRSSIGTSFPSGNERGHRAELQIGAVSSARSSLLPLGRLGSTDTSSAGPNRRLKSIGLSLLLPGTAQLRSGRTSRGLAFLGAEGAIWAAFATFRFQGSARRDSYLEMARLFAGVEHPEGRDDDYYRLLGLINSSDVYDVVVRNDARTLYPDDVAAREAYVAEHRIPEDRAWQWESDAARARYREKRNDSQSAYRASRNMIGLAVANRLAAMFDAVLSQPGGEGETRLSLRPGPELGAARLTLTRKLP